MTAQHNASECGCGCMNTSYTTPRTMPLGAAVPARATSAIVMTAHREESLPGARAVSRKHVACLLGFLGNPEIIA